MSSKSAVSVVAWNPMEDLIKCEPPQFEMTSRAGNNSLPAPNVSGIASAQSHRGICAT
jgi:hypothetical protein